MKDVKTEIQALKNIAVSYGFEAEWNMLQKFHMMMTDDRFFRLLKNYDGNNPKILESKSRMKW